MNASEIELSLTAYNNVNKKREENNTTISVNYQ